MPARILYRRRDQLAPGADDRVRELREGEPLVPRERIGADRCDCGREADVYDHDPRARGWLRAECSCGLWWDLEAHERERVVATRQQVCPTRRADSRQALARTLCLVFLFSRRADRASVVSVHRRTARTPDAKRE